MTTKKTYIVFLVPLADLYSFYLDFQFHVGMVEFSTLKLHLQKQAIGQFSSSLPHCHKMQVARCTWVFTKTLFVFFSPSPSLPLSNALSFLHTLTHVLSNTFTLTLLSVYLSLSTTYQFPIACCVSISFTTFHNFAFHKNNRFTFSLAIPGIPAKQLVNAVAKQTNQPST